MVHFPVKLHYPLLLRRLDLAERVGPVVARLLNRALVGERPLVILRLIILEALTDVLDGLVVEFI